MFAFAIEQDILTASPCAGLQPPAAEVSRDYGAIVRLLALTGGGLREVSEMKWSEVDLEAKVWTLPRDRTKNNTAHQVPLARWQSKFSKTNGAPRLESASTKLAKSSKTTPPR